MLLNSALDLAVCIDGTGAGCPNSSISRNCEKSNTSSNPAGQLDSFRAVAATSFTKTSITMAGVDPIFLNPCIVPLSMKYA